MGGSSPHWPVIMSTVAMHSRPTQPAPKPRGEAAKMIPLPKVERNPLSGGASHDDVIGWLAYTKARAMYHLRRRSPPKAGFRGHQR